MIFRTLLFMLIFLHCNLIFCSEHEVNLGRSVSATIFGKYTASTNKSLIRYVNLVGQAIVSTSGRKDINFYFSILESDKIQAFAAPGGYIFITTGLLNLIQTEAELAGVLAHEIAHVNLKHVYNKVYSPQKKQNFLSRLLKSKNTSLTIALNEISDQALFILLNQGLTEMDEYESDIATIFYLQNTGYSCQGYLNLISRLPHSGTSHSKTHPEIKERIHAIKSVFNGEDFSTGSHLVQRFEDHAQN